MTALLAPPRTAVPVGKRVFDATTAAVLLVVLSPFLLILMAAVVLTSPGPALYRQERVGKDSVPFQMIKLRTMTEGAHAMRDELGAVGPLFKLRRDPRFTPIGGFLRRHSLDELPQLWNVLRGEMSLIGPRPALPEEVAEYTAWEARRLSVLPGMTGLWQVSGRSDLPWEEAVRLDLEYVDRHDAAMDASILLRTVGVVITAKGAY